MNSIKPSDRVGRGLLWLGIILEASLGLIALALGWLLGVAPAAQIAWNVRGLALGIAGTIPLVLALVLLLHFEDWRPIARIRQIVEQTLGPLLDASTWPELAVLGLAAGLGEELLFRGLAQTLLTPALGAWSALVLTAAVFGLAHAITPLYAILAGAIGLYLGWAFHESGNLLVPIVAHGAYDVVALIWLRRIRRPTRVQESRD